MNTTYSDNPRGIIKQNDGFWAYYFSAQIAYVLVRISYKIAPWISPNVFTLASTLFGILAALAASQGTTSGWIWFIVLLNISFILDCCDGQLARLSGKGSTFGAWFDFHSDRIKDGLLLLGVALGVYFSSFAYSITPLVLAFIAIYAQNLRSASADYRTVVSLKEGIEKPAVTVEKKSTSQLFQTLKHSALFRVSDRVMLFSVFAGLQVLTHMNWMYLCILIYTILVVFFAIVSGIVNYKSFWNK